MKKLAMIFGAVLFTVSLSAQRFDIGVNIQTALPMGDYNFGDEDLMAPMAPGFGIGGGVEANYWFSDAFSAGLEVGFVSLGENDNTSEDLGGLVIKSKATMIPIIAKAQYYFLEDALRPYVGVGVGYGIVAREYSIDGFPGTASFNQNGLIISPRAGALYQLTEMLAINLAIQYNLMQNKVDGNLEVTVEADGTTDVSNEPMKVDATNYLGINLGVSITL